MALKLALKSPGVNCTLALGFRVAGTPSREVLPREVRQNPAPLQAQELLSIKTNKKIKSSTLRHLTGIHHLWMLRTGARSGAVMAASFSQVSCGSCWIF